MVPPALKCLICSTDFFCVRAGLLGFLLLAHSPTQSQFLPSLSGLWVFCLHGDISHDGLL